MTTHKCHLCSPGQLWMGNGLCRAVRMFVERVQLGDRPKRTQCWNPYLQCLLRIDRRWDYVVQVKKVKTCNILSLWTLIIQHICRNSWQAVGKANLQKPHLAKFVIAFSSSKLDVTDALAGKIEGTCGADCARARVSPGPSKAKDQTRHMRTRRGREHAVELCRWVGSTP